MSMYRTVFELISKSARRERDTLMMLVIVGSRISEPYIGVGRVGGWMGMGKGWMGKGRDRPPTSRYQFFSLPTYLADRANDALMLICTLVLVV